MQSGGRLVIAIDGKTVRGAKGKKGKAPHLVAALAHGIGAVLAQVAVDEKVPGDRAAQLGDLWWQMSSRLVTSAGSTRFERLGDHLDRTGVDVTVTGIAGLRAAGQRAPACGAATVGQSRSVT
jgi:hypothetical protein